LQGTGCGPARDLCRRTWLGIAHADWRGWRDVRCIDGGGQAAGFRPAGYRAIESLRLEKGYRAWGADITPNDSPFEAGLGWAVKLKRNIDFMGRAAAERTASQPLRKRMAGFTVDDPGVTLLGRETILRDGEFAGYLSSGGFGYTIGKSIGYGYLRCAEGVTEDWIKAGRYELLVAGERAPAEVWLEPMYDDCLGWTLPFTATATQ
jgi:sarcosine dehydrogenase